jgi:hypothetical protein
MAKPAPIRDFTALHGYLDGDLYSTQYSFPPQTIGIEANTPQIRIIKMNNKFETDYPMESLTTEHNRENDFKNKNLMYFDFQPSNVGWYGCKLIPYGNNEDETYICYYMLYDGKSFYYCIVKVVDDKMLVKVTEPEKLDYDMRPNCEPVILPSKDIIWLSYDYSSVVNHRDAIYKAKQLMFVTMKNY